MSASEPSDRCPMPVRPATYGTTPGGVTPYTAEARSRDPELRAVIHADGNVTHRRVLATLDALKQGGLTRVAFGAEEPSAPRVGAASEWAGGPP